MPRLLARAMPWLAPAALVLSLIAALPPVASYSRQYAFAQALQFVTFAVAAPALLVLGVTVWLGRRADRGTTATGASPGRWQRTAVATLRPLAGGTDHRSVAGGRSVADRGAVATAAAEVAIFVALVIAWRLPAVLEALARYPALTAAEMVSLLCAGSAVWIDLLAASPWRHPLPRPLRATMAAVAMWTIWIVAYVTGMSGAVSSWAGATTTALSDATERQLGVGVLWAVPAICFMPVVYATLISWLGDHDDPDAELRAGALPGSSFTDLGLRPRPPRGWRSPLD